MAKEKVLEYDVKEFPDPEAWEALKLEIEAQYALEDKEEEKEGDADGENC